MQVPTFTQCHVLKALVKQCPVKIFVEKKYKLHFKESFSYYHHNKNQNFLFFNIVFILNYIYGWQP